MIFNHILVIIFYESHFRGLLLILNEFFLIKSNGDLFFFLFIEHQFHFQIIWTRYYSYIVYACTVL